MKKISMLRTLLGALSSVVALQACGPETNTSSIKHDMNDPTRSNDSWNWVSVSDAQYKSVIAPLVGIDTTKLLANDHQITKRLQMWLDKVDAQLRTSYPDKLVNVPKPQARVVIDDSPNAFVAPAPVCYKVGVQVASGSASTHSTIDRVFLDVQTGDLSDVPAEMNCIDGNAANLKQFVADFNAASASCKYELKGAAAALKLVPNTSCKVSDELAGTVFAKNAVILETANWVTVHTGIIPLMDEDAFVAVASHELGHYYRSHMTAISSYFDFYYTLDDANPDHRPVPEAAAKADGEKAYAAATLLSVNDIFTAIDGQKDRSELFFATGSLIRKAASASGAAAECKTAADFFKSSTFTSAIDKFPFVASDSGMASAYESFETKARACLAKLTVKANGDVTASGASWKAFIGLVSEPVWPTWLGQLPADMAGTISTLFDVIGTRLGDAPAVGTTWDKVLDAKSAALATQNSAGVEALKTAHNEHIGQYTIEQEADEESAEWIAKLGFDPKAGVDAMHALVMGETTSMSGLSLGQKDCEALFNHDWMDATGAYQFVPVGDFAEIHHSTCYRMFNLTREIAAHHEAASGAALPAHGGQGWKDLQKLAKDASDGSGAAPLLSGHHGHHAVAPMLKKSHAFDCVYSSQYL